MRQRGFTLIEAVVSAGVFAMVMSGIIGIYISAAKIDRRTRAQRAVVQNARYVMDFIAKEVRNGRINYAAYPGGSATGVTDQLHVINQAGEAESFIFTADKITLTKNSNTSDLTDSSVRVTKLLFITIPTVDPFAGPPYNNSIQPSVTVVLEVSNNGGLAVEDQSKLLLQSTFTERYYPSRQ